MHLEPVEGLYPKNLRTILGPVFSIRVRWLSPQFLEYHMSQEAAAHVNLKIRQVRYGHSPEGFQKAWFENQTFHQAEQNSLAAVDYR